MKMKRTGMVGMMSGVALALVLSACSGSRNMTPARSAQQVSDDAAVARDNNVKVITRADAWTGDAKISEEVTPMRVTIENNGNEPVRVQYQNFKLVGTDGQRFAALPPLNVSGTVPMADLPDGWVAATPAFAYDGFDVAPYYTPVYSGIGGYTGYFPYDPYYYGTYYSAWPQQQLPTAEMILRALPEGVVRPGGRVEGFVYFERVPDDVERLVFSATLQDANSQPEQDQQVASVEIPFTYK